MFDIRAMRLLYGRSPIGKSNRINVKITLTPQTKAMIENVVPWGQGRYGSSLIELAVRVLISLSDSGEDLEDIARELKRVSTSPYIVRNLERLLNYMKS